MTAVLHCGDWVNCAPSIGDVDHLVFDPPYEADAHTNARRVLGRSHGATRREVNAAPLPFAPIDAAQRAGISAFAKARCRGWVLAFSQVEAVGEWRASFENAGLKWRRAMIWVKPDSTPQLSGDRPAQGCEAIASAWAGAGGSVWNGGGRRGVFTVTKHDPGYGHGGRLNKHPTQKPLALMKQLVELFTQPGDVVFDPYMGSGTTGVACIELGRRFIGCEVNPVYFALAERRIHEAGRQSDFIRDAVSA